MDKFFGSLFILEKYGKSFYKLRIVTNGYPYMQQGIVVSPDELDWLIKQLQAAKKEIPIE